MYRTMFEAMAADAANDAEGLPPGWPRPDTRPRRCEDCGSTRRVKQTIEADGDMMLCPRCFNERDADGCFE